MPRRWKLFLVIGFLSLVLDQGTKLWARVSLPVTPAGCEIPDAVVAGRCHGQAVAVIDGVWDWRLGFNPGSAFGLFGSHAGARVFLSIIGIGAVLFMLWMVHKGDDRNRRLAVALGLIVGGAVGNVLDRIRVGVVTDFIVLRYERHEWPTFNVADIVLVVGVAVMLFVRDTGRSERLHRPPDRGHGSCSSSPDSEDSWVRTAGGRRT